MQHHGTVPGVFTHSAAISACQRCGSTARTGIGACEKGQPCRQALRILRASRYRAGVSVVVTHGAVFSAGEKGQQGQPALHHWSCEHNSGCALEGIANGAARCASCPASVLGFTSQQLPGRRALRSRASEGSGLTGSHRCSAERATVVRTTTGSVKVAARRTGCSASEALLGFQQLAQCRVPRRRASEVGELAGCHRCSAERATVVRSATVLPITPYGRCSSTSSRGMCSHTMLPAVRARRANRAGGPSIFYERCSTML